MKRIVREPDQCSGARIFLPDGLKGNVILSRAITPK